MSDGHALRSPQEACGLHPLGTSPLNEKSEIEAFILKGLRHGDFNDAWSKLS